MNHRVSENARNFSTSWGTFRFSRRTAPYSWLVIRAANGWRRPAVAAYLLGQGVRKPAPSFRMAVPSFPPVASWCREWVYCFGVSLCTAVTFRHDGLLTVTAEWRRAVQLCRFQLLMPHMIARAFGVIALEYAVEDMNCLQSVWWSYIWFLKCVEYLWLDLNSYLVDWHHLDPFIHATVCTVKTAILPVDIHLGTLCQ